MTEPHGNEIHTVEETPMINDEEKLCMIAQRGIEIVLVTGYQTRY